MNKDKRDQLVRAIDQCIEDGFSGKIQVNFYKGKLNHKINITYTQSLELDNNYKM